MPNSKNYDLDIDTTLGGNNASDYVIPSQKAIKAYVDNNSGGGSSTDVQINGTSITSGGVANILTNTAYNASSNKIATMSDVPTVVTYTGGTGISIGTGNAINHTNSITAGTAGTSSDTSGSTLAVPYVTYDAQGHVTATGTHTHRVTGFLTSSSTQVASTRFDGQWVFKYKVIQTTTSKGYQGYNLGTSGTGALSYLPSDCTTYKYEVACVLFGNSSNTSYGFIASTATNVTNGIYGRISTNSNSRASNNAFIVVVTNGMIYVDIDGSAFSSSFEASLTGYRRIGTNS